MPRKERTRGSVPSRSIRLREFFSRLQNHRAFTSVEDAYTGLVSILDAVEDELTGIPNDPRNWQTDGRLYPPQPDNWFRVPDCPGITRMRTKAHNVFIAANGAIEIRSVESGAVVFTKAGADGREVWDHE